MHDIITIIKKEMARFFGDKRLVFTTVIMPGLMIYLMYSLMGEGMMKQFSTADDYVGKAYCVNMPTEIREMTKPANIEWEDWDGNDADKERILKEIADGEKDLLIYFPENFMTDVAAYDITSGQPAPQIEMYFSSEKSNSGTIYSKMQSLLSAFEESLVNKYDINMSAEGEGKFGSFDQASETGMMGKMLSGLLPMLIMTFIFSGCSGVAPESIAGEKERGTIATLLVTPVKRSALAFGKVISLSIIALLAGISSFLGTTLSLPKMMGGEVDMDVITYSITDYLLLFVLIISTVLVMVSIISLISAYAKSVKEATTMMAPFMVVIILVSLIPMLGIDMGGKATFFIPLLNSVTAMTSIFGFNTDLTMIGLTIGANVVITGVLVTVLTKMFGNENIMFGK